MRAGSMRHRITIQRERADGDGSPNVSDGIGGTDLQWIDVCTVWAQIRPLSTRELSFAAQLESDLTHEITIRARDDVTAVNRIKFGTRYMNIRGVRRTDEIRHEMILDVDEGPAT